MPEVVTQEVMIRGLKKMVYNSEERVHCLQSNMKACVSFSPTTPQLSHLSSVRIYIPPILCMKLRTVAGQDKIMQ